MVADAKVTEFKSVIADSTITDTNVEYLFDLAANTYNIFGASVPIMAGAAGSKTVTYTSAEKGAVFQGARIAYVSFYKNAANTPSVGISGLSISTADLMSNSTMVELFKEVARRLVVRSFKRA